MKLFSKNLIKSIISLCSLISIQDAVVAQELTRFYPPVTVGGKQLVNAWAGGMNSPQWSKADLNNDGVMDLYVFDRNGGAHITFLNVGSPGEARYLFAPQYASNFPMVSNFALLRDFNGDGAADLFAHAGVEGIPGIKVYRGYFQNGQLKFNRIKFKWEFDVLTVPSGGGFFTNILVNAPDMPAIDDLDGDGDIDILGLNSSGSKILFYQNRAVERGLTKDTLLFEVGNNCWGNIFILPFSQSFVLSGSKDTCALRFAPDDDDRGRHGGATLSVFDADGDGDNEVLYGDLIYSHIVFGRNGGTKNQAWITSQDTTFPSTDVPVMINEFPAVFSLDIDNDGLKDLIASPNLPHSTFDRQVAWFYKNTKANDPAALKLQKKNFLVDEMLDFGTGAHPVIVDYNADGLPDLAVANFSAWLPNFDLDPFISLFKNTGTAQNPKFELVDENWLNFRQFRMETFAFAPTFADMDDDGDLDLITGERYGTLYFAENTAGPGKPLAFGPIQPNWQGIALGQYSVPIVYDLNEDGLPDLLIGERNGNINFMPNIGSKGNPKFHSNADEFPNNHFLGKVNTQQEGWVTGYSAPAIFKSDGTTYLVSGSEAGNLYVYKVNKDSLSKGAFDLVGKDYGKLREGGITRPVFGNLNGDVLLDMVAGNYRGGVALFSTPFKVTPTVTSGEKKSNTSVAISPVPAKDQLYVELENKNGQSMEFQLFNIVGQLMKTGTIYNGINYLDISSLVSGPYILRFNGGEVWTISRFVKQ